MGILNRQSLGGQIRAKQQRDEALKQYYEHPSICMECGKIIPVGKNEKVHNVVKKKFCNKSCAATYNNRKYPKREKVEKMPRIKIGRTNFLKRTKGELFANRSNWQSARSNIQKTARDIYNESNKPKCCIICGYDKHYEVAHIKAVSEFLSESTIAEINNIDNLIALCPNHHWEYDHGFLQI